MLKSNFNTSMLRPSIRDQRANWLFDNVKSNAQLLKVSDLAKNSRQPVPIIPGNSCERHNVSSTYEPRMTHVTNSDGLSTVKRN